MLIEWPKSTLGALLAKEGDVTGKELMDTLVLASGLPRELVESELSTLAANNGFATDTLNIDQVKLILTDLLQDLILKDSE